MALALHVSMSTPSCWSGADCLQPGNDSAASLQAGQELSEVARIKEIKGETIKFFKPLKHDHPAGDHRDRRSSSGIGGGWMSDMGTVFWHDHAFGATTWPHGGFGATIVEPFGSTYHDPKNGKLVYSGPDRRYSYAMSRSAPASAGASVS